jgi:hypothetical protein
MTYLTSPGSDDPEHDLLLLNPSLKSEWLKLEPTLMTGKWFDYRFMSAVEATYLYASEFVKAYRRMYRENIDGMKADYVLAAMSRRDLLKYEAPTTKSASRKNRGRDPDREKHNQYLGSLWRGRQTADAMGVPYEIYLELAFQRRLRYWQKSHLPRPHQLYSDLCTDFVEDEWKKRQRDRLYFSTHENYQNARFSGLDYQDQHHEWLLHQADLRGNPPVLLADLIWRDQVLPVEKVRDRVEGRLWNLICERAPASIISYN